MRSKIILFLTIVIFIAFVLFSILMGIESGYRAFNSLVQFVKQMVILLPFAFILIGLFEVWVKKDTVERYLGTRTGFTSYLLAIVLAGMTVGGLYVAFPVAYLLFKKGAKMAVVFTYIGAAGICRIPMTFFEASFMGLKFTIVRLAVSLPLIIVTSWLMGNFLQKREYVLKSPEIK